MAVDFCSVAEIFKFFFNLTKQYKFKHSLEIRYCEVQLYLNGNTNREKPNSVCRINENAHNKTLKKKGERNERKKGKISERGNEIKTRGLFDVVSSRVPLAE